MSDDENAKIGCLCHFGAAFQVHIQRQLSSIQLSLIRGMKSISNAIAGGSLTRTNFEIPQKELLLDQLVFFSSSSVSAGWN